MDKFLIMIDLDGTMLKNDKSIPLKTIDVIKSISNLGHKIVISTGRPFYKSQYFYHTLALDTFIVNRNGGLIYSPQDRDYHFSVSLDKTIVMKIMNSSIYSYIEHFYIEDRNDLYILKGNYDFFKDTFDTFDHLFYNDAFNEVTMFTLLVDNDHVEEVMTFLNEMHELKSNLWKHQGQFINTMIEVFPVNITKASVIKKLCEFYQIPIERTIAIGDEENDIEMIKIAQLGVAMKNAVSELKDQADIILEHTNEENGVGLFLEELFLSSF